MFDPVTITSSFSDRLRVEGRTKRRKNLRVGHLCFQKFSVWVAFLRISIFGAFWPNSKKFPFSHV